MDELATGLRYRLRRAVRQIGDQHRHMAAMHRLLGQTLADGERRDAQDAFVRYRHAIGAHFELEDDVFFPAIHGLHPEHAEDLDVLSREHGEFLDELKRMAAELESGPLETFARSFQRFSDTLAAHEAREERLVSRLSAL
jgi:hemerythrin-like domain-containing protein